MTTANNDKVKTDPVAANHIVLPITDSIYSVFSVMVNAFHAILWNVSVLPFVGFCWFLLVFLVSDSAGIRDAITMSSCVVLLFCSFLLLGFAMLISLCCLLRV